MRVNGAQAQRVNHQRGCQNVAGGRGSPGNTFSRDSTSHPAWWVEKPSGRGGQGAASTPNSRTRRTWKGPYSPSRWDIVPANDCVAPGIFPGISQKPAGTALTKTIIILSLSPVRKRDAQKGPVMCPRSRSLNFLPLGLSHQQCCLPAPTGNCLSPRGHPASSR